MKLTHDEKLTIAQRAAGSYATISKLRRIVEDHKRNRDPDDAPYLEFGRLVLKQTWTWPDYERLQRGVLNLWPEPFGPQYVGGSPVEQKPKKSRKAAGKKDSRDKPPQRRPPKAGLDDLLRVFGI